jgi:hypothetical protein
MPLLGKAFLMIWHDIREPSEPEYHRWHTREHMPERLSIPGFLRGRRGVAWNLGKHRYLTIYEGAELATFGSPAYLERLNNPTPWSTRVQPAFYNFIRSACETVQSVGLGVGGALATLRIPFGSRSENDFRNSAAKLAGAIHQLDGVSSVHFGIARPQASSAKTRETELRGTTSDGTFEAVVVVDGVGRRELEAAMPRIADILGGDGWIAAPEDVVVYDLAYALDHIS